MRGRAFSIYLVVQMVGLTLAQVLLSTGKPREFILLLSSAVIFAIGAFPIWLARAKAPAKAPPIPLNIFALMRLSPLGATTTVLSGVSWAIIFTFGPVYAQRAGFTLSEISLFMGVAMVGGAVMQFPLGWLSDTIGRRATITLMSAGGTAASLLGFRALGQTHVYQCAPFALIGALVLPLYGLGAAHTNDRVSSQARVAAAAGLVLLFGIGSILGPLIVGGRSRHWGLAAFFVALAGVMD